MPSFLSPFFLAGLLALAVPVLVHLRRRERKTALAIPSLMFVRKIPHKARSRRTLAHLALFAARCLAVAALALAFARPFFAERSGAGGSGSGYRARVVLLDVSASMRYDGAFERARAEARGAIAALAPTDRAGVILFSDRAEGAAPPSSDHARARSALERATPTERGTRLAPALQLAASWLAASDAARRDVVIITDAQRRQVAGAAEVTLPRGAEVVVKSVARADASNVSITDVAVERSVAGDRELAGVVARIAAQGGDPRQVRARLEIGGRTIEEVAVRLAPNGVAQAAFARAPLPAGATRARVAIDDDALEADNAFHLVLGDHGDVPLLLVDAAPFVERALAIGDRPRFAIRRRAAFDPGDLPGRRVAIVDGTPVSEGAVDALRRFVEGGGGLIVALSGAATPPRSFAAIAGGEWRESIDRISDHGASLGYVDLDHPALLTFKKTRGADFSRARFLKYRALAPHSPPTGTPTARRVLARFDDGREAIVETAVGRGRVVVIAGSLDGVASDLPLQPIFLPLVHELARYAAGHEEAPLAFRTGDAVPLAGTGAPDAPGGPVRVRTPSGRTEALAAGATAVELLEAGFHEITTPTRTRLVAANVDPAESDLAAIDADELGAMLGRARGAAEAAAPGTPETDEARQAWWRLALAATLLALLAEPLIARFGSRTAAAARPPDGVRLAGEGSSA